MKTETTDRREAGFPKRILQRSVLICAKNIKRTPRLLPHGGRPGLTFDTITMPSPREQDAGSVLALLDPAEDMAKIDWFEFRNRAVSEAIIALCKVVKEETGGRWLCGAYYGYLIAFSNIFNRLQTVGTSELKRWRVLPTSIMSGVPPSIHGVIRA